MADNEPTNPLAKDHPPQFGLMAVDLGYITPGQLQEALMEQRGDDQAGRPRLPIGSILYEKGWITLHQFEDVFNKRLEAALTLKKQQST